MSLLKAARGGVIEDLAVDWGTVEATKEPEDDFELISEAETAAPQKELPPLGLFDEETAPVDTAETGPQKIMVQLPPPPVIQQAPKSDKLPIPLYPGFRCSIFAIIKQSANPGPYSPIIKITGKVLGRAVAFRVPVTPISLDANTTSKAMESGKLLHTLAAKALIQTYEDLPSSAETKAQIERLGKRYSLASSVTSFLAIDHDSSSERRPLPLVQVEVLPPPAPRVADMVRRRVAAYSSPQPVMQAQQYQLPLLAQATGYMPMPQSMSYSSPNPTFGGGPRPVPSASLMRPGSIPTGFAPPPPPARVPAASYQPPLYRRSSSSLSNSSQGSSSQDRSREIQSTIQAMNSNISQMLERGEKLDSLQDKTESLSQSSKSFFAAGKKAAPPPAPSALGRGRGGGPTLFSRVTSAFSSKDKGGEMKKSKKRVVDHEEEDAADVSELPTGPLTLESIARAQQFDGSFPHDPTFLTKVCSGKPIPALPAVLANATGDANVKEVIWATVLVLACLKRVFVGEKDSWEMMAEKATTFVEDALVDIGADASLFASLIAQAGN